MGRWITNKDRSQIYFVLSKQKYTYTLVWEYSDKLFISDIDIDNEYYPKINVDGPKNKRSFIRALFHQNTNLI